MLKVGKAGKKPQNFLCLKAPYLREIGKKVSVHDHTILVSNRLEISVISAQLLNLLVPALGDRIKSSIKLDLYDLPNDTIIDKYQTPVATSDGYNTVYTYAN